MTNRTSACMICRADDGSGLMCIGIKGGTAHYLCRTCEAWIDEIGRDEVLRILNQRPRWWFRLSLRARYRLELAGVAVMFLVFLLLAFLGT